MPTSSLPEAKFVFRGTVVRTRDATMPVPDRSKTAIVRVDEIVRAPEVLLGYAGAEITVQLAEGERLKSGQQAVFHTNGWLYGKSLGVQSVGHEAVAKKTAAAGEALDPARAAAEHTIAKRTAQAEVVITGKVVAIGLPAPPAGEDAARQPISEHTPLWSEAVVQVEKVHKGSVNQQQVVVRFPTSTDVRWHGAPKFRVGQEGVFLLQPDTVTKEKLGVTAAAHAAAPAAYTCLHPADFQPAEHPQAVAAALKASSAGP